MKSGEDIIPTFCFNSSKKLIIYELFPGQKIFVSLFHPIKAIQPTIIEGNRKFIFKASSKAKITEHIENNDCLGSEKDLASVMSVHTSYEIW